MSRCPVRNSEKVAPISAACRGLARTPASDIASTARFNRGNGLGSSQGFSVGNWPPFSIAGDHQPSCRMRTDMTADIVSLSEFRARRGDGGSSVGQDQPLTQQRRKRPREGESPADRRSEHRYSVEGACAPALTVGCSTWHVANLSRNGFMVAADVRGMPGARMLVTLPGCRPVSARLIWKRNGLAGLEARLGML